MPFITEVCLLPTLAGYISMGQFPPPQSLCKDTVYVFPLNKWLNEGI